MSLLKNIPLGNNEARYLELRLEAFNVFNHPNFTGQNYGYSVNGPWEYSDPSYSDIHFEGWELRNQPEHSQHGSRRFSSSSARCQNLFLIGSLPLGPRLQPRAFFLGRRGNQL